jgi:hypothetical protein
MQTFLPYSSYEESAKCLDYRRLGKQRVEAFQILTTLLGISKGWVNHPAVKMWKGYEGELVVYGKTMCNEWIKKGYKDTLLPKFNSFNDLSPDKPFWIGDYNFHLSHKSNLLRKDYEFYSKHFGTTIPKDLPYIWPNNE